MVDSIGNILSKRAEIDPMTKPRPASRDAEAAEKRRLDRALEETFPGPDSVNVTQPPPSKAVRHVKRRD